MGEKKNKELEVVENQDVKETEVNGIKIAEDVVAKIAGIATAEVKGVSSMNSGFVDGLFGKKNFSKGVKVQVNDKDATIDLFIMVDYGCRIPDIAWEIQNRVKTSVENMTGLKVLEVNIHVQGVNIPNSAKEEKSEEKKDEIKVGTVEDAVNTDQE